MIQRTYGRWIIDEDGRRVKRFTALDPADQAVLCTCGKVDCHRARLLPFRDHVAELYRTLQQLHWEDLDGSSGDASSVLYGLRMAASIGDVEADTGYVEDPMVFALCEPTIDYENAQSEMASKYVAAAAIFNFLWLAYEAAVELAAPAELRRLTKEGKLGERGRRLLETRPEIGNTLPGAADLVKLALVHCRRAGLMSDRCARIEERFSGRKLVTAAELCREFRNFLYHGEDEAPHHEDWGDAVVSRFRIYRFYSVSRLLLYLIQAMFLIVYDDDETGYEIGFDGDTLKSREMLYRLQFREIAL